MQRTIMLIGKIIPKITPITRILMPSCTLVTYMRMIPIQNVMDRNTVAIITWDIILDQDAVISNPRTVRLTPSSTLCSTSTSRNVYTTEMSRASRKSLSCTFPYHSCLTLPSTISLPYTAGHIQKKNIASIRRSITIVSDTPEASRNTEFVHNRSTNRTSI